MKINSTQIPKIQYIYILLYVLYVLFYSVINVLTVYPFIGLADGFNRWQMALDINVNGRVTYDTVLSPILPLFKLWTYNITNSFGFFTFIQTIVFYLSIGLLSFYISNYNKVVTKYKVPVWFIISVILLQIPTMKIFPLLLTDAAFTFSGLVALISWGSIPRSSAANNKM